MDVTNLEIQKQVAHDIRSPLGILELLIGTLNDLSDEQRQLFDIAMVRLKGIADDVLNYKIPTHINLIQVTQTLVKEKIFEYTNLNNVKIEFRTECHSDLNLSIALSEYQRVLSNLINNAVEAVNGNGWVKVSIKSLNQKICIEVCDDGVGIPAHILPKLLKGSFTHGKKNGHGLGLSHARKTVNSWGGELEIESVEGKGTTVSIHLVHPI